MQLLLGPAPLYTSVSDLFLCVNSLTELALRRETLRALLRKQTCAGTGSGEPAEIRTEAQVEAQSPVTVWPFKCR